LIRLVGPFHRGLTTVSGPGGKFVLSGVPALPASVTCERNGEVVAIEPLGTHVLHGGIAVLSLALGALLFVTEQEDRTPALVFGAAGLVTSLYVAFRVWRETRSPIRN
jgi:hypothetical protein